MGRHGYSEDLASDDVLAYGRWRGIVRSATRGKRGQAMLKELLHALDAMPVKELIKDDLITEEGACCTIGALLAHKEVPEARNLHEWNEKIAEELDVHEALIQEIEFENDEGGFRETPAEVWVRMRTWVAKQIQESNATGVGN